jgi:hypothetical protein
MSTQTLNSIAQRFNSIRWHDSKLSTLSFYRVGSEELVKISLKLIGENGAHKPINLVFKESTYIKLDVDLEGKSECSDDISDAECLIESELLRTLTNQNPYDNFQGYLHFCIELIPPGGTINILAKNFLLE